MLRILFFVISTSLAAAACKRLVPASAPMVAGGDEIGESEWPAVVRVMQPGGLPCTGTFIRAATILTAGHCTVKQPIRISGRTIRDIRRLDDSGTPGAQDVALLLLDANPSLDPPPLALASEQPAFGTTVTLIGYGYSDDNRTSGIGVKRKGVNHISSVDDTIMVVHNESDARSSGNAGITGGDSGGPLLVGDRIVGVATGTISSGSHIQGLFVNVLQSKVRDFIQAP